MANDNDFDNWDFYEDNIPSNPDEMYNICFPIFNKCSENAERMGLGTGFLIGNDGKFLSAGHVFKGDKDITCFKVYFKGREYEIKCLYFEYEEQSGKDLFIGQLIDFTETITNECTLSPSDTLQSGDLLKVGGFSSYQYSTYLENEYKGQKFYNQILNTSFESIETKEFSVPFRKDFDKRLTCPNIKILNGLEEEKYKGISGGPVYSGKNIYGVCIADLFITSEYIIFLLDNLHLH